MRRSLTIAMVCDFFYPQFGGVESHLFQLSQCLMARGHRVIVVTHAYGPGRQGVRWLTNGMRVYHLPFPVVYQSSAFPYLYMQFALLRNILIREQVDVVHGHGAFSCMCHEAILHGGSMGLHTVFTDHSLFGFSDASSILMNKVLRFTLSDIGRVICVSHTSRENTTLRANLDPHRVSVIPNAVDSTVFRPDLTRRDRSRVTIVVMSRLCYRKGTDLVIALVPRLCAADARVHWLIGGNGDRMVSLVQTIEAHQLQERVTLLGEVQHANVADVLTRGDIFLNASLTEAFCIAIVEAVSCGLLVVSTDVGGVPEVFPAHATRLASPTVDALEGQLRAALAEALLLGEPARAERAAALHTLAAEAYSWHDIAERTERVYDSLVSEPVSTPLQRVGAYYRRSGAAGWLFALLVVCDYVWLAVLCWLWPASKMDHAPRMTRRRCLDLSEGHYSGNAAAASPCDAYAKAGSGPVELLN